jgi:hypothetical protein
MPKIKFSLSETGWNLITSETVLAKLLILAGILFTWSLCWTNFYIANLNSVAARL